MSATLNDKETALAQDVAGELAKRHRLTEHGQVYVERFARYLLKVNGVSTDALIAGKAKAKRPTCKFPIPVGRMLRQDAARELQKGLQDDGRNLLVPVGVLRDTQGREL
jgi:hypothetical protein